MKIWRKNSPQFWHCFINLLDEGYIFFAIEHCEGQGGRLPNPSSIISRHFSLSRWTMPSIYASIRYPLPQSTLISPLWHGNYSTIGEWRWKFPQENAIEPRSVHKLMNGLNTKPAPSSSYDWIECVMWHENLSTHVPFPWTRKWNTFCTIRKALSRSKAELRRNQWSLLPELRPFKEDNAKRRTTFSGRCYRSETYGLRSVWVAGGQTTLTIVKWLLRSADRPNAVAPALTASV